MMSRAKPARQAPQQAHRGRRRVVIASLVTVVVLLATVGAAFGAVLYFDTRAHPGVEIAGVSLTGQSERDVQATIAQTVEAQTLTIRLEGAQDGSETLTVHPSDLGVTVDIPATATAALAATNGLAAVDAYNPWEPKAVAYVTSLDEVKFAAWVDNQIASHGLTPTDAIVRYDQSSGQFTIRPSAIGRTIDTTPLRAALDAWAADPATALDVALDIVEKAPDISDAAAQATADEANKRLGLDVTVRTSVGSYTVSSSAIARWSVLTPDPEHGVVTLTYDTKTMRADLADVLADEVEKDKVDQIVTVNPSGVQLLVDRYGEEGTHLADESKVIDQIVAAIERGEDLDLEAETKPEAFKTISERIDDTSDGKWIDVNLSTYRVTPYIHNEAQNSFLVSYGKPGHETPVGVWSVLWTTPQDRMVGNILPGDTEPEYDLLVDWVTYFTEGGVAFHSAPWVTTFGTNISHGCVNMTPGAAEWIYWWTPAGTPVVVHY
jgi:hypothetical protein